MLYNQFFAGSAAPDTPALCPYHFTDSPSSHVLLLLLIHHNTYLISYYHTANYRSRRALRCRALLPYKLFYLFITPHVLVLVIHWIIHARPLHLFLRAVGAFGNFSNSSLRNRFVASSNIFLSDSPNASSA